MKRKVSFEDILVVVEARERKERSTMLLIRAVNDRDTIIRSLRMKIAKTGNCYWRKIAENRQRKINSLAPQLSRCLSKSGREDRRPAGRGR